jgi:glycosyltransferase involved in cell wall biosynthesis
LVSFTAPPNQDGVAMAVGLMEKDMRARNWDVKIAATEPGEADSTHPETYYVPRGFENRNHPGDRKAARALYSWLDRVQPAVIVIHSWLSWPISTIMPYAMKRTIPVFLMGHGFCAHRMQWAFKPPFFGLARWMRSWAFIARMPKWIMQMAGLVVLGKRPHYVRAFDHWLAKTIRYKNLHVIPNAVNQIESSNIDFRGKYSLEEKLIFLCVAGYSITKDQHLVLKGFDSAGISNATLVFIGPSLNDYALELKRLSSDSEKQILILDGLPRKEVEAAIQACDVAILGSRSEMQPIFLLEAMSEGKPWVCPKVGAVDELEGGIVCPRSVAGLSDAMVKLTSLPLRLSLGALGKCQWQAEFSSDNVYDRWNKILREALLVR